MPDQVLWQLVSTEVPALGVEFWGLETSKGPKGRLIVRIYIETPTGASLEECQMVSRHLGRVLDVEEVIQGGYDLEVSSPGMRRRFFTLQQAERYLGSEVKVKLAVPVNGQRNLKTTLLDADSQTGMVSLTLNGQRHSIPFSNIETMTLRPVWK